MILPRSFYMSSSSIHSSDWFWGLIPLKCIVDLLGENRFLFENNSKIRGLLQNLLDPTLLASIGHLPCHKRIWDMGLEPSCYRTPSRIPHDKIMALVNDTIKILMNNKIIIKRKQFKTDFRVRVRVRIELGLV